MSRSLRALCLGVAAGLLLPVAASANESLLVMQENAADWVMPTGDYANTRYSKLAHINSDNVGDLQVDWTFSTGVLRGHEGGPLVIGDRLVAAQARGGSTRCSAVALHLSEEE